MGLIDRLRSWLTDAPARSYGWDDYGFATLANGQLYPLLDLTMPGGREEEIESNFRSYVSRGFKGNGIVFSIMRDRMALFSQARFKYQNLTDETLFGKPSLDILEHPWPNATTGDLLARAISDADAAGNHYATRRRTRTSDRIKRMRPDWVTMVFGTDDPDVSSDDLDAEFLGIIYYPGGEYHPSGKPEYLQRSEIAHFAPIPDPLAHGRGMSWLTPIVREIMGDSAASTHKLRFFENGATPQMIVKRTDAPSKEAFKEWREIIEAGHTGTANAYKTLYLTAGADATVVGKDMQQLEFKATQGAGETRIAAAGGIHPVVAGLSEGMQGASLNAGNFATARRLVADKTLWWLWGNYCGSMETLVPPPSGARLWVDASGIPFLREDRKDAAEIQSIKATTIRTLTDGGWEPASVLKFVDSENASDLEWSGLVSVQLQEPGTTPSTAPTNGKTPMPPQEAPA
jgi:phage portal protein BeeE